MKKIVIIILIFFIEAISKIYAGEIEIGIQGGYSFPSISIEKAGDEIFGSGSGKELKDIIGLKDVGGNFWLGGSVNLLAHKYFYIQSEINYWSKTETTRATYLPEIQVNTKFSDVSIGANIILKQNKRYPLFFGGGLSLHHLKINVNPISFPEVANEGSKNKIGFAIIFGIRFNFKTKYGIIIGVRDDFVNSWNQVRIYSSFLFKL